MSEKLREIFERDYLYIGESDREILRSQTEYVMLADIGPDQWSKIRHLCMTDRRMLSISLPEGGYLSHDGAWLIVDDFLVDQQDLAARCGGDLRFLRIDSQLMAPLDLTPMKQLAFLHLGKVFDETGEVMHLKGLEQLTALETLRLHGTFDFRVLNVAGMKNLAELSIRSNQRLETVHGLAELTALKMLSLFRVDAVRELDFSGAWNLAYLRLGKMGKLTRIPPLGQFHDLEHLSVYETAVDLPSIDVSPMARLNVLSLHDTPSLKEIHGLERLDQLTRFNISGTSIHSVPEALRGKPLKQLDLSALQLDALPDWLPELGLEFNVKATWHAGIRLQGTTVEGVDMSIFDQPREMILQWFEARKKRNQVRLDEIKVVFLGDGDAGKSHTIARLINDGGEPVDYTDQSTPGIVIKHKPYTLDGRNFKVHYWDFGGQEILHSMHRIFLTERTLYVVLVNARDETQDARARYWLHNIHSFAPGAPVILVLNKIDQNPKAKVNEPDLRDRYENLRQVIPMSALEFDRERFNREFTHVLLEEILQTGYLDVQWPRPWTQVKGELEHMETNYIRGDDYQRICRKYSVDKNETNLLHWFNDLGISYCCCDDHKLEDYLILRPDWITNALYIILFNNCPGARNGLIPHTSIHELLRKDSKVREAIRRVLPDVYYKWDEISYVLEVFRKSQLSFCAGGEHEFIPMLCDPASAPAAQQYAKDENALEFRMVFDYLPNNLLHQLMVDRKDELRMDQVWRTGALFEQRETGFNAVVTIDGDMLRFFVRSGDPMHRPNTYLAMLKANVDRIRKKMGLREPVNEVVYKLDGKRDVFDYDRLKDMLRDGVSREYSRVWRRSLDISDIMNQAAPAGLEEQDKLLDAIIRSCQNIQGDMRYIGSDEDDRNNRMRDDLEFIGYTVRDQTRRGSSGSGKNPGELDIEVRSEDGRPWTVIEALRVHDGSKTKWNAHLDKLLGGYNAHGAPFLFLVTYVDDTDNRFGSIWESYRLHIARQGTERFRCVPGSFEPVACRRCADNQYIRTARCRYTGELYAATVYHIFVRIGQ